MAKRIGLCLFATVITTCMLLVWTQGLANAKEVVNLVARVTAYSHIEMGNDITASGKKVKEGYVALSRDIELEYGLKFGDKIKIAGLGTFEFQDRMNKKKKRSVDVYVPTVEKAFKFGARKMHLQLVSRKEQNAKNKRIPVLGDGEYRPFNHYSHGIS